MIPILTAQQFRDIDQQTLQHESISEIELMERAATGCAQELERCVSKTSRIAVVCGNGNNGGDGIAIGRMLREKGYDISIYRLDGEKSAACANQLGKTADVNPIETFGAGNYDVIVDALLGTGTTRELSGRLSDLVLQINFAPVTRISIDIPSGLSPYNKYGKIAVKAHTTLVIGAYKLTQFLPEMAELYGNVRFIPIYPEQLLAEYNEIEVLDKKGISALVRPRKQFSHKGTYGHALLIAGSKGKAGAAILSASACVRSGVGLLTIESPETCLAPLQISVPEAMVRINGAHEISGPVNTDGFTALGIGPGLTTGPGVAKAVLPLYTSDLPKVIDADALNILSQHKGLEICNAVLTPHPKEFSRLAGKEFSASVERFEFAREFAKRRNCVLVLKDAVTIIFSPEGKIAVNSTGNPGMATGGMGDTLTGIVLGLLAQDYSCWDAARIAVFHHGLAGDKVAEERGQMALLPRDVIEELRIG